MKESEYKTLKEEYNELIKMIDNNEIISFDIFDTLLLRNVIFPVDIFRIMAKEVEEKYNIKDFYSLRVNSEMEARVKNKHLEDIEFFEIYNEIAKKTSPQIAEDIKKIELNTEKKYLIANPFMLEVYKYALKKKKQIYIISDMYLEDNFIEECLKKSGYSEFTLYVSGKLKKTKAVDGHLYEYIKEKENLNVSKWLHIGDSLPSDIYNSKKQGLNAFYYQPLRKRANIENNNFTIEKSIAKAIQINYTYTNSSVSYFEKLGIEKVSLIYYGFVNWLVNITKNKDNLYFFSRDGYLPFAIYNMFKEKFNLKANSKYIYTSRKAYQIPGIILQNREEALTALTEWNEQYNEQKSIEDIFSNVGLNVNDFITVINSFELKKDDILTYEKWPHIKKMVSVCYPTIKKKLEKDLSLVEEYLKQESMEAYDEINIVDIGWRGSIHNVISLLYKQKNKTVDGYYIGLNQYAYQKQWACSFGYLFDYGHPINISQKVLDNLMMFEIIFSSPERGLKGFEKKNGKVIPVFKENENSYSTSIKEIQDASIKIIKSYLEYYDDLSSIKKDDCIDEYIAFIEEKNYDDIVKFKDFTADIGIKSDENYFPLHTTKEELKNNMGKILEKSQYSLWKGAIYIEGVNSLKELEKYAEENNISIKNFKTPIKKKMLTRKNIILGVKDPINALKYIQYRIKSR